jgi:hypothetical protein
MQPPRNLGSCQTNQESQIPYLCLQMHLDNHAIGQENHTPGNRILFASMISSEHFVVKELVLTIFS